MSRLCADRNGSEEYVDMAYLPKKYDPSPAIIMISSEMPEAMGMSDRIIVLSNHKYSGQLLRAEFTQEAIAQMRSRNYPASVEGLGTDLLLVAVTYDKDDKTKPHHCRIESF